MKKTFVPEQKENFPPSQPDQVISLFIDHHDPLILGKRVAVREKNRTSPPLACLPQDEFEKEILEKFF